ncbi:sensor histidine kinase [Caldanaerobius polysaccharolyticus]|uniref:sensor histidine kinase n=1 Tax=Caldanaerobius polysaccharolyticus TaxID=44256 RepID=UPI00047B179B|nr:ATP-binding protein [Caldanaerobius polysaccharolyticus]
MFNTLSGKIFASYLMVILITVLIVGLLFSNALSSYIVNAKSKEMETRAAEISQITASYFLGKIDGRMYYSILKTFNRSTNCAILVVDKRGKIVAASFDVMSKMMKGMRERPMDLAKTVKVPPQYVDRVNSGQGVVAVVKMAGMEGLMIITGVPVFLGDKVAGGVFLNSPIKDIAEVLSRLYLLLIIVTLMALAMASVISAYLSRLITRPLRQMSRIALAMAKGDYKVKVNIRSDDEIGQLGRSLNYLASESERLENMRRDFIANVSHELRTPLTAIRGFMEPLIDGTVTDKEDVERCHKIIYGETLRMQRLINDLLDLSRLQAGKISINMQPIALRQVVDNVIAKMKPQADGKGIRLINRCPDDISPVLADEDRIQQVLIIFIDNGIKYTGANGTVTVTAEEGRSFVEVRVEDTGMGISSEDLERIWERFYKADKARGKDGAGLGLAIAKEIVQLHGGTVSVKSQVGRGSVFGFTLKKAK